MNDGESFDFVLCYNEGSMDEVWSKFSHWFTNFARLIP